jgi:hypothetical protein
VALVLTAILGAASLTPADALSPPTTGASIDVPRSVQSTPVSPENADAGSIEPVRPIAPAVRLLPAPVDMVSVSQSSEVSASVIDRARAAAADAGGRSAIGRSAAVQMTRLRRGTTVVQAAPDGWRIPFGVTVLPVSAVRATMGRDVAAGIERSGNIVMARSTADLRGAQVGDRMDLRTSAGGILTLAIAAIVPDATVGSTELVMHPDDASRIGVTKPSRVLIWGMRSRDAIDGALGRQSLVDSSETGVLGSSSTRVRIRRSWSPADPDVGLSLMETKVMLGEFPFVVRSDGGISIGQGFIDDHIDCGPINYCRRQMNPSIPIKARCHRDVVPAVQGALAEVADAGLAWTIDVGNANTYGGCFFPRFNRLSTSPFVGFLSRHTWGMALDTNTTTNAQGSTPRMDCRTVRIFRKWGFAWGGNYLTPDGMHFEYVGEPRHRLPSPSKYCPNTATAARRGPLTEAETSRPRFFGHDGLYVEQHDH